MEQAGINIHYEDNVDLLDKDAGLVIYTPAVPKDHKEFSYYLNNGYPMAKRSAVLGEVTSSTFNICVAGTHGKTTISAMIAHILRHSAYGCNAFLGGISANYNTNFWSSDNNVSVAEADEYDRSFLKLSPDIAVISAMDADHLDIYGTKEKMEDSFIEFSNKLRNGGLLLTKYGLPAQRFSAPHHLSYSLQNNEADVYASGITMRNGGYEFDVMTKDWMIDKLKLNMGGMHNVENAVAAIAVALHLKIDSAKIKNAIQEFKGVSRRFQYILGPSGHTDAPSRKIIFIDDYAHHPQELVALIKSAKSLFSTHGCTVIFQPHLFSRTKDLAKEFAQVLDMADRILLLPVYPARELPIEGVSSQLIREKMQNENVEILSKDELMKYISTKYVEIINESVNGEMLITAGAGDIDQLVQPIKNILVSLN